MTTLSASPTTTHATTAGNVESQTLRQYGQTLLWTAIAIGVCALCYAIEKYVFLRQLEWITDVHYRMFKNPAELPMRLFGLPHFIVGTMFLLSSPRVSNAVGVMKLLGLAVLGIGLCVLFYKFGRVPGENGEFEFSPIALLAFYFYFLIHGFRDEAFFYKAFGEMPKDQQQNHNRIMVILQILMLGLLISLAIPAYVLLGDLYPKYKHPLISSIFPADWPYLIRFLSTFTPMVIVAFFALTRIAKQFPDGFTGLWRAHRPILTVFLISTGIILVALATGPWTFNFVVLMHFVAWYLFGRHMIAKRPPKEPVVGVWNKIRRTKTGFTVFHLGLAALFVVLVAIEVYVFGKNGYMEPIIGSKSFFYWTIMHVTLSFYPR
ncbi:MAG: hypothetical protein AB7N71_06705 [Phycisphaerae bacterium]